MCHERSERAKVKGFSTCDVHRRRNTLHSATCECNARSRFGLLYHISSSVQTSHMEAPPKGYLPSLSLPNGARQIMRIYIPIR